MCGAEVARVKATATAQSSLMCPECLKHPDYDLPALIYGHVGLGDVFYQKPAIRKFAEVEGQAVCFETLYPQVFWDAPEVHCIRRTPVFDDERRNFERSDPKLWRERPSRPRIHRSTYGTGDYREGRTPTQSFERHLGLEGKAGPGLFRTMLNPEWIKDWIRELPRPFGVVHPPTLRHQYANLSRSPKPGYIQEAMDAAPEVFWVSIAALESEKEWLAGPPLRGVGKAFDHAELCLEEVFALVALADVALTGPCFMLPMAASLSTPVFVVFGGNVPPHILIEPRMGDSIGGAAPDPFCACWNDQHDCSREIDGVGEKFKAFLEKRCLHADPRPR